MRVTDRFVKLIIPLLNHNNPYNLFLISYFMEEFDLVEARVIKPPVLDARNFSYKLSDKGIIKTSGFFTDYNLPENRVVLCYNWGKEELKRWDDRLQKEIGSDMPKKPRDIVTLNYFQNTCKGFICTSEADKLKVLFWADFDVNNSREPQKLEHMILERVKELRLQQIFDYNCDAMVMKLMAEYICKFGNANSWKETGSG